MNEVVSLMEKRSQFIWWLKQGAWHGYDKYNYSAYWLSELGGLASAW